MKQTILALILFTATSASAAPVGTLPSRPFILAQLGDFYTMLCEDVLGGRYGYDQTNAVPSSWYCAVPGNPDRKVPSLPIRPKDQT